MMFVALERHQVCTVIQDLPSFVAAELVVALVPYLRGNHQSLKNYLTLYQRRRMHRNHLQLAVVVAKASETAAAAVGTADWMKLEIPRIVRIAAVAVAAAVVVVVEAA